MPKIILFIEISIKMKKIYKKRGWLKKFPFLLLTEKEPCVWPQLLFDQIPVRLFDGNIYPLHFSFLEELINFSMAFANKLTALTGTL